MSSPNSKDELIGEFRAFTDRMKSVLHSRSAFQGIRHPCKTAFDFLVTYRSIQQDVLEYDADFLNCAAELVRNDVRRFFFELERVRQSNGCCGFVIRPVVRHLYELNAQELESLLSIVPYQTPKSNGELSGEMIPLEIMLELVEILKVSIMKNNETSSATVKELLEGFLRTRPDQAYLRLAISGYLFYLLRGNTEASEEDKRDTRALKLVFSWLISSSTCKTREALKVLMRVLGCKIPSGKNVDFIRFRDLGLTSERGCHYALMLMIAKELDLPLANREWERLILATMVFPSSPLYWKDDNSAFLLLGLYISDTIFKMSAPLLVANKVRLFADAMWHRMRAEYLVGPFSKLCKVAELDLTIRICLIDRLIQQGDYDSANKIFEFAWNDCTLGMFLGERDVWHVPFNYIQYLFYYKVAKLDSHFGQWHNIDRLSSLPVRVCDRDEMTCRGLCINCLLKNESTVPWEDIRKNDPVFADMIESFKHNPLCCGVSTSK